MITKGKKIRSYDFMNLTDCFMEGVVEKVENGMIYAKTTRFVRQGIDRQIRKGFEEFRTPEIGNCFLDEGASFQRIVEI